LPFPDESVEICVTSSVFEHAELFWVLFLEILRILKPDGLLYLNAPSNGSFHRYPADCWRFYPDSGKALVTWARRNGFDPLLLESYVSRQVSEDWNDFVAVFVKEASCSAVYPRRILDSHAFVFNARVHGTEGLLHPSDLTEDQLRLEAFRKDGFEYLRIPTGGSPA
jgi:SAM-dependent methyltransferase